METTYEKSKRTESHYIRKSYFCFGPNSVSGDFLCNFIFFDIRPCLKNKSCTNGYDLVNY